MQQYKVLNLYQYIKESRDPEDVFYDDINPKIERELELSADRHGNSTMSDGDQIQLFIDLCLETNSSEEDYAIMLDLYKQTKENLTLPQYLMIGNELNISHNLRFIFNSEFLNQRLDIGKIILNVCNKIRLFQTKSVEDVNLILSYLYEKIYDEQPFLFIIFTLQLYNKLEYIKIYKIQSTDKYEYNPKSRFQSYYDEDDVNDYNDIKQQNNIETYKFKLEDEADGMYIVINIKNKKVQDEIGEVFERIGFNYVYIKRDKPIKINDEYFYMEINSEMDSNRMIYNLSISNNELINVFGVKN